MADYVKLRIADHLTGETLYRPTERADGVPWEVYKTRAARLLSLTLISGWALQKIR